MSVQGDCYTEVVSILKADATLSSYVKKVFDGLRENIPHADYPCLCVEPALLDEKNIWLKKGDFNFTVYIMGYTYAHAEDKDQIVGTGTRKGILDFQEDTLNALRQNQTLNGKAIEWDCSRVGYEFRTWPVRGFIMEIVIHARRSY